MEGFSEAPQVDRVRLESRMRVRPETARPELLQRVSRAVDNVGRADSVDPLVREREEIGEQGELRLLLEPSARHRVGSPVARGVVVAAWSS